MDLAMPRIIPLDPPYPEETARTLESMMPPDAEPLLLFRTIAHNPRILAKIRSSNLLDRGSLDRSERELAILRTCARCESEYEWGIHVRVFARRFGLSQDQIDGTRTWHAADDRWGPRGRLIVGLVDVLHETARIPSTLWRELELEFAAEQLIELIVLIGFYHTISFVANGLEIDLESDAARFPREPVTDL
jgi:alkylhydroperoxidase family enzyme